MSADTFSPLLGLLLQGTGNNNNAWGENLNDQVITLLENSIAASSTIVSTGGTYTLSAAEARSAILIVSGASPLTSDLTIVVPDTTKLYAVINNNTKAAGFFVLLKTSFNSCNAPFQKLSYVVVQPGAIIGRLDSFEVGRYVYDSMAALDDVLECDGAYYKRLSLPNLFSKIGTTFGTTDSSNFRVPLANDTGRFLRSRAGAVAAGTSQSNQNQSHTHTGAGTTAGQSVSHTHTGSGTTTGASADHSHTFAGTTATESATHTHTIGGLGTVAVNNGTGASQGNLLTTSGGSATTIGPSNTENQTHTHTFSGTTSGFSVDHTHTYSFTTATNSVDHTHTYSFTTATNSVDHTHTYSFTTSTGSADGAEARPEALVGVLCIRY